MRSVFAAFVWLLLTVCPQAAEIRLIGLAGMTPLMRALGPEFEQSSGHKLLTHFASGAEIRRVIEAGERFDLAVISPMLVEELSKVGKVTPGPVLFRNGIGVVVRDSAPRPDISSSDGFKRAVLNATSLAYTPGRASGIHVEKVLAALGIAEQVRGKIKPQPTPEQVATAIARGDAELGFAAMNLLVGIPGTAVVGPFPAELQDYIVFALALPSGPPPAEATRALIEFLQTERAKSVMRRQGLLPM